MLKNTTPEKAQQTISLANLARDITKRHNIRVINKNVWCYTGKCYERTIKPIIYDVHIAAYKANYQQNITNLVNNVMKYIYDYADLYNIDKKNNIDICIPFNDGVIILGSIDDDNDDENNVGTAVFKKHSPEYLKNIYIDCDYGMYKNSNKLKKYTHNNTNNKIAEDITKNIGHNTYHNILLAISEAIYDNNTTRNPHDVGKIGAVAFIGATDSEKKYINNVFENILGKQNVSYTPIQYIYNTGDYTPLEAKLINICEIEDIYDMKMFETLGKMSNGKLKCLKYNGKESYIGLANPFNVIYIPEQIPTNTQIFIDSNYVLTNTTSIQNNVVEVTIDNNIYTNKNKIDMILDAISRLYNTPQFIKRSDEE